MAVHPTLTTRTTSRERWEQAGVALRLLRLTQQIVGPVNADFRTAFAFKRFGFGAPTGRRTGFGGRRHDGGRMHESGCFHGEKEEQEEEEEQQIQTPFSGAASLWSRAEDFWHVVGWAFNCSCSTGMHAKRWEKWSLWLNFMVKVLEEDWELLHEAGQCEKSLIYQYVITASGGSGRDRRILRAVFADGTTKSMNEFREVFHNELKEPAKDGDKIKKREVDVDIEADVYGDYMVRDDDDSSEEEANSCYGSKRMRRREPSTRRVTPRSSKASLRNEDEKGEADEAVNKSGSLGGIESLGLRMKLLHLLSNVAGRFPDQFTDLEDLYTLFIEFIKPLPLPTFQTVVSPSVLSAFSANAHTALCEYLLQHMLEPAAPTVREEAMLTQTKLEKTYLPFAANKTDVAENAKVSILLEALLRYLAMAGHLRLRPSLRQAVREGIQARRDKPTSNTRKAKSRETFAWALLVESGERMTETLRRLQ